MDKNHGIFPFKVNGQRLCTDYKSVIYGLIKFYGKVKLTIVNVGVGLRLGRGNKNVNK